MNNRRLSLLVYATIFEAIRCRTSHLVKRRLLWNQKVYVSIYSILYCVICHCIHYSRRGGNNKKQGSFETKSQIQQREKEKFSTYLFGPIKRPGYEVDGKRYLEREWILVLYRNLCIESECSHQESNDLIQGWFFLVLSDQAKELNTPFWQHAQNRPGKHETTKDGRGWRRQDSLDPPGKIHCRGFASPSNDHRNPPVILFLDKHFHRRLQDEMGYAFEVSREGHRQTDDTNVFLFQNRGYTKPGGIQSGGGLVDFHGIHGFQDNVGLVQKYIFSALQRVRRKFGGRINHSDGFLRQIFDGFDHDMPTAVLCRLQWREQRRVVTTRKTIHESNLCDDRIGWKGSVKVGHPLNGSHYWREDGATQRDEKLGGGSDPTPQNVDAWFVFVSSSSRKCFFDRSWLGPLLTMAFVFLVLLLLWTAVIVPYFLVAFQDEGSRTRRLGSKRPPWSERSYWPLDTRGGQKQKQATKETMHHDDIPSTRHNWLEIRPYTFFEYMQSRRYMEFCSLFFWSVIMAGGSRIEAIFVDWFAGS